MSDTPFKSPHPHKMRGKRPISDSEESIISETGSTNSNSGTSEELVQLSLVALFDEQQRLYQQRVEDRDNLHENFLLLAEQSKLLYEEYMKSISEGIRLRNELDQKIEEVNEANRLLRNARKMFDEEHKKRKYAEHERDELKHQIAKFCNALVKDSRNMLVDDAKEQISNLYSGRISVGDPERLSAIKEINSTGSILSDFSFSRSEDDLDSSRGFQRPSSNPEKSKHKHVDHAEEPVSKKRRSSSRKAVDIGQSETVRATTTLTIGKAGPITATSVIESVPKSDGSVHIGPPPDLVFESWATQADKVSSSPFNNNNRQHCFQQKTIVMPNSCSVCEKHIRFGKTALKCKECRLICHIDCRQYLPTPCVPVMNTPSSKKFTGTIADYTPATPPMVPALIVHCVNEIEQRGLNELGIYRIPGSEKDVKELKEKFLSGRLPPNLKEVDIHVICGCVKEFLRSLAEHLITTALWNDFITAVRRKDPNDIIPVLCEAISKLPQPNRDTLAFMILHLQKVAQSPECKMPADNLAKVFGPTIVGYSTQDTDKLLEETRCIVKVMSHLLNIQAEFWMNFINVCLTPYSSKLQQTPSTDSLLRPTSGRFFTPVTRSEGRFRKRREGKFFGTPPAYK